MSKYKVKQSGTFQYIDEGQGETIVFLHGLFGALSNWDSVIDDFKSSHRVVIPLLPIYTIKLKEATVPGLTDYVEKFTSHLNLSHFHLVGNSLGGHIGLVYTLRNPEHIDKLVLTGSSGLFEDGMGGSFPRRGDYDFVRERVGYTFYDAGLATKELVDTVFEVTNNNQKCLRMIAIARSAQKHNMAKELDKIKSPTLLIWGLNDTITPPFVGHEFNRLISDSYLRFIDKCGHAPMMEHPVYFNKLCKEFLVTKELV